MLKRILAIALFVPALCVGQITESAWVTFSTLGAGSTATSSVDTVYSSDYARAVGQGSTSPRYNLYEHDSLNATSYYGTSSTQFIGGIYSASGKYIINRQLMRWPLGSLSGITVVDSAKLRLQKIYARDSTLTDTTTTYGLIVGTYSTIDTTNLGQYNDFHGWKAADSVYTPAWITEQESFETTEADTWETINFSSAGCDSLLLSAGDTINTLLVGGNDMKREAPDTTKDHSENASWMSPDTWYLIVYSRTVSAIPFGGSAPDTVLANPVRTIFPDSSGRIWWGTSMGSYRQDSDITSEHYAYGDSSYQQKSRNNILSGAGLANGDVYFGTPVGLTLHVNATFSADSQILAALPDSLVTTVLADSADAAQIWLACDSLVYIWDDSVTTVFNSDSGLIGRVIHDIAVDSTGSVWIATNFGVSRILGGYWIDYTTINSSLIDNEVYAIAVSGKDSSIWFGSSGGVVQFDGDSTWTDWSDSLSSRLVRDIVYSARDTTMWFATDSGITGYKIGAAYPYYWWERLYPGNTSDNLPQFNTFCVQVDSAGRVWVGHSTGATRFTGN
jgi:hypothetical protein